ncbi:hypothetical protein SEA_BEUFFERT_197 [Streptomyces phage Beuffert]|nr:hypothetical protein SEA_BEUFFERT_197 [Streptomyces phage Beuffert]
MEFSIPVLLGIAVVLLNRKWDLSVFHAIVCVLFGISIATSPLGENIWKGFMGIVDFFSTLQF